MTTEAGATNHVDLYKCECSVLEAKQGSNAPTDERETLGLNPYRAMAGSIGGEAHGSDGSEHPGAVGTRGQAKPEGDRETLRSEPFSDFLDHQRPNLGTNLAGVETSPSEPGFTEQAVSR